MQRQVDLPSQISTDAHINTKDHLNDASEAHGNWNDSSHVTVFARFAGKGEKMVLWRNFSVQLSTNEKPLTPCGRRLQPSRYVNHDHININE